MELLWYKGQTFSPDRQWRIYMTLYVSKNRFYGHTINSGLKNSMSSEEISLLIMKKVSAF